MIPWLNLDTKENLNRFYHLFNFYEFEKLIEIINENSVDKVIIENSYYEMNNYCIIIKKL